MQPSRVLRPADRPAGRRRGRSSRLAQVDAGVDAVQLFDSWAGVLPEEQLFGWSLEPMVRIAQGPACAPSQDVPIIAFPRAVGPATLMYRRTGLPLPRCRSTPASAPTGRRANCSRRSACKAISIRSCWWPAVQAMEREATRILDKLGHGSFVFNLGHGVVPQTPPDHVARLVEIVRNWKPSAPHDERHVVKIAIILFNLGGPIRPTRSSRSCATCSAIQRSCACPLPSCVPLASFIWPGVARPRRRADLRPDRRLPRRSSARPRRRRARSRRRWEAGQAASTNGAATSACATGIR